MALDKSKTLKSAEKFIASGKTTNAIDEYLKILRENPKDWNLMIQIGDLYLKINKIPDAISWFQKVADHYFSDGFFLKAIAIYKRVNKLDPSLTEICIKLSELYLKQGLTMDAKTQLQSVAQQYLSKNQNKDAIHTLKKLIEIEPENIKTRNDLAKAYKNEGMIPEAIREFLDISDQLSRKGLLKESLAVLEMAYKLDPKDTETLRKILAIYQEQNEPQKGTALVDEALRSDPSNPEILALLAETHAARRDFEKAHEAVDRALLNASRREEFRPLKGDIFLKAGDVNAAFGQYVQVVDREIQRKEIDTAVELLQKITQADPSFHPAWLKLSEVYSMLRQHTNTVSSYGSLVDALISKSLYADALKYVNKLIELDPDDDQHKEKLEFVRSFVEETRIDARLPEAAMTPEPVLAAEEEPEVDVAVEIEMPSSPPPPPSRSQSLLRTQPAPPPLVPLPPMGRGAASSSEVISSGKYQISKEEKEYVSEHLIEAEVFNKYGLIDKALEQVHGVLSKFPNSVQAHQKLKEIYLEKGERDKAVEECIAMARILRRCGEIDQAEDLLSEARQINANHPALEKAFREVAPPAAAPPKGPDVMGEIEKLAQNIKTKSGTFKVPSRKPPTSVKLPPELTKSKSPQPSLSKQLFDSIMKSSVSPTRKSAPPIARQPVPAKKPAAPPPSPPAEAIEIEIMEPEQMEKPIAAGLPDSTFEEIDFFADQGMKDESWKLLRELKQKHPEDPGVLKRVAAMQRPQPAAPARTQDSYFAEEISINLDDMDLPPLEIPAEHGMGSTPNISGSDESSLAALDLSAISPVEIEVEISMEPLEQIPEVQPEVLQVIAEPQPPVVSAKERSNEETWDLSDFAGLARSLSESTPAEEPLEINLDNSPVIGEPAPNEPPEVDLGPTEFAELEDANQQEKEEEVVHKEQRDLPKEPDSQVILERTFGEAMDDVFRKGSEPDVEPEPVAVKAPEELFEEEDEFFDLAAELEEGFLNVQSAVEDDRPPDGQTYSFEEILTDFKKGVEKQLGAEDYDTRYNLGIAYKEMGLIDEAIAEFQIAAKDLKRFLECCSMLGLCFLEKGMNKLAVKWYQRGLDTPGYSDDEYQGLRFDLGQVEEASGDFAKALEIYQEVYGVNANYRNVSKKIKELQDKLKKK